MEQQDKQHTDESDNILNLKQTNLKFECEKCQKLFKLESSLRRHHKHSHEQSKEHKCDKCNASFSQRANLQVHQLKLHTRQTEFQCSDCGCFFTRLNTLNRHKSKQHNKDRINYNEDDPTKFAQIVLIQLKSLEEVISSTNALNSTDTNDCKETITHEETFIDDAKINETNLTIKLNPERIPETINIQTVKRPRERLAYVCKYCAKEFYKTYNLIRHLRTHTKERPFICPICNANFSTKTKLREHSSRLHKLDEKTGNFTNQHKCSICDEHFKCRSLRQLEKHMKRHDKTQYYCDLCKQNFWSRKTFSSHRHKIKDKELEMLERLLPEPISLKSATECKSLSGKANYPTCKICGLKQRTEQHLCRHQKHHEFIKKFKCNTCGSSYASNVSLLSHKKLHNTTKKKFSCCICPTRKFETKSQLKRHNFNVHNSERNFKCSYCRKTFKSKSHCKSHMKTHLKELLNTPNSNSLDIEIRQSKTTNSEFIIKTNLTNPNLAEIKIEIMSQSRSINNSLSLNENFQSSKYICSHCSRQFQKPSDLLRHERLHTKERPFKCQVCEKSFTLKSTLDNHQITHLNERERISCQVCGKQFASQKSLKIHLRLHTGAMPFSCEFCHKTFRTSGHRLSHLKTYKNGSCKISNNINKFILNCE